MEKIYTDCYFFYYSTCENGDSCPYRHCLQALGTEKVCKFWLKRTCFKKNCAFRHMDTRKNRATIPCYHETQQDGCLKPHCPFKHSKARDYLKEALGRNDDSVILPVKNSESLPTNRRSERRSSQPEGWHTSESETSQSETEEPIACDTKPNAKSKVKNGAKNNNDYILPIKSPDSSESESSDSKLQASAKPEKSSNNSKTCSKVRNRSQTRNALLENLPKMSKEGNERHSAHDVNENSVHATTTAKRKTKTYTSRSKSSSNAHRNSSGANTSHMRQPRTTGYPLIAHQPPLGFPGLPLPTPPARFVLPPPLFLSPMPSQHEQNKHENEVKKLEKKLKNLVT